MSVRLRRPAGPQASVDGAGPVGAMRRRRLVPVALAASVLAAGGAAAMALLGGDEDGDRPGLRAAAQTATVTRQTLVERETVEGTLGYAGTRTVLNRLATAGGDSGTGTPNASGDGSDGGTAPARSDDADAAGVIPAAYFAPGQAEAGPDGSPPGEPSHDDPSSDAPAGEDSAPGVPTRDDPSRDTQAPEAATQGPVPGGSGGSTAEPDSSTGSGSGTVTALPRPGSVVRRGEPLYRVDGEPIVLMYGATPAYRDLELGVEDGRDVRQLEENLAALGFDPGTVDTEFTSTTAAAVTDWQESAGLPETGAVELGRIVFLPGARRIGEHRTSVGSVLSAGSEVLDTSSTRRVVTIELDAALQSLARKGDRVEVTLPNQSTLRGRISDVGRVAREKEASDADSGAAPGAEQELVIDVTVRLRSARGIGRLDEAPVSVGLAQESRKNVLAVPVEALVARRGGGYGVELAAGRRVVPVRTGLFAGGYVEVAGSGIREGARVVVPDA